MASAATTLPGKAIACWAPITTFVALGLVRALQSPA